MTRPVRVTRAQARRLTRRLIPQQVLACTSPERPLSVCSQADHEAPGDRCVTAETSWPGAATHYLADPVRCQGCDRETVTLVQALDGLRVGPPLCPRCHVDGLPKRRRRGKAAEGLA